MHCPNLPPWAAAASARSLICVNLGLGYSMAEAMAGALPKKKQVIYAGSIAASQMGENEFVMRQPLIDVVVANKVSKFDGKRIDEDVGWFLMEQAFMEAQKMANSFSTDGPIKGELQYRPVMCSLLSALGSLAPRAEDLLQCERMEEVAGKPTLVGFQPVTEGMDVDVECDDPIVTSDLAASFHSDMTGWSATDTCFRHEDGASLKVHEAVDVRCYKKVAGRVVPSAIFEMKFMSDWLSKNVFQTGYYGSCAAIENVRAGRFKPIPICVLGYGWLGCAEVDPVGCLKVGPKNKLTLGGVASFKDQVRRKCEYLRATKKSTHLQQIAELEKAYLDVGDQELLTMLQDTMEVRLGEAARKLNVQFASDLYQPVFNKETLVLVGKLRYRRYTMKMLEYPVSGDVLNDSDTLKYLRDMDVISGIARILYGDRVLKWTLPAVQAHLESRQKEWKAEFEAFRNAVCKKNK